MTDADKIIVKKVKKIYTQREFNDFKEKMELELKELREENDKLTKQLLTKKNEKKEKKEKVVKQFEGDLDAYSKLESNEFSITKVELRMWIKNPDEVKIIKKTEKKNGPCEAKECVEYEGQCWARKWNMGNGARCCLKATIGDYCKTHFNGNLKEGDVRITGVGSVPKHKVMESNENFISDLECVETADDMKSYINEQKWK
tara:strand:+ start:822 stop:1424 length:603 start_codon:yes stop_codon:yes gene_type:complete